MGLKKVCLCTALCLFKSQASPLPHFKTCCLLLSLPVWDVGPTSPEFIFLHKASPVWKKEEGEENKNQKQKKTSKKKKGRNYIKVLFEELFNFIFMFCRIYLKEKSVESLRKKGDRKPNKSLLCSCLQRLCLTWPHVGDVIEALISGRIKSNVWTAV